MRAALYWVTRTASNPMTEHLYAAPLSDDLVGRGLPLVQVTWPHIDSHAWLAYVQALAARARDSDSGVLAVGDRDDYLYGFAVYEVEPDLLQGRVLTFHLFTALDLINSVKPVQVLLEAAAAKAAERGCSSLRIRQYDEPPALGSHLRNLGLTAGNGYLWKRIASNPFAALGSAQKGPRSDEKDTR